MSFRMFGTQKTHTKYCYVKTFKIKNLVEIPNNVILSRRVVPCRSFIVNMLVYLSLSRSQNLFMHNYAQVFTSIYEVVSNA